MPSPEVPETHRHRRVAESFGGDAERYDRGLIVPFHYVFQTPPGILDALASAYRKAVPDSPPVSLSSLRQALDAYQALFGKIADRIRQAGAFSEPEQWKLGWERTYTRGQWLKAGWPA